MVVTGAVLGESARGVGARVTIDAREMRQLRTVLADDPIRAVQSLPRVAAADDFRSEFSVRASPYRHIGVVIDGVETPWLQHVAYGRGVGSISMLSTDVIESATLQAGAFPQRHGNKLGAQLGMTIRHGSRDKTGLSGTLSGTSAAIVSEGPLGRTGRGSWLAAIRQSLLEWPIKRRNPIDDTVFGFTDALAKLAFDPRPGQQISVTALGGRTGVDGPDDRPPQELANGTNRAGLLSAGWRGVINSRLVLTQQAHVVGHRFLNKYQTGQDADSGASRAWSYRADAAQAIRGGLLEAGWQIQRLQAARRWPHHGESLVHGELPLTSVDGFAAASWLRSGYLNFQWRALPTLTVTPGIRLADSSQVRKRSVGRWLLGEWAFRSDWSLTASAGVAYQFPDFEHVIGPAGSPDLRPERAAHGDVGISQRFASSMRWQVSLFGRRERDTLRQPAIATPSRFQALAAPETLDRYENALEGHTQGVEFMIERRQVRGISGWIAYSYGESRQTDEARNETYWADFDQRHALNVSALYSFTNRTSFAATFRSGTNFPIPGYLSARDGGLYLSGVRNDTRLPVYARLDLRAQRTFDYANRRITLFVEVLNALNRTNVTTATGFFRRSSGEAVGFTEPLLPRLPSAGIRIDF